MWTKESGAKGVHRKNILPDEEPCWELTWYHRGNGTFEPTEVVLQNGEKIGIGFLVSFFMKGKGKKKKKKKKRKEKSKEKRKGKRERERERDLVNWDLSAISAIDSSQNPPAPASCLFAPLALES